MTPKPPVASRLLPVSILAGPSARVLLRGIIAGEPERRFALLTETRVDSGNEFCPGVTNDRIVVEQLAGADSGIRDLREIREQISALAAQPVQHLAIECDSQTHPIAFASLFLPDGHGDDQHLSQVARLTSIVLAIDSDSLVDSILHGKRICGVSSPCILADQIECADSVVLDGDPAGSSFRMARAIASSLNPRAHLIVKSLEKPPLELLAGSAPFDFESTFAGAGWRKQMEAGPGVHRGDNGVATFLYEARRPFHPERFWNLLQRPFAGVFRAKGFFWLATRMEVVGGLNLAASDCHCSPAGQWWAAIATDSSERLKIPDRVRKEWVEPFGDRRQAIAFMGVEINPDDLTGQLDYCLLSESEMISGEEGWKTLPDPFPDWSAGHDHDQECGDHDCCHH